MSIRVALHHRTTYRYERPAVLGPQVVRLRPAPHNRTPIHRYSLEIKPGEHFLNWQQDVFGNYMARLVIPKPTGVFEVEVDLVADLEAYSPFDYFLEESCKEWPFPYGDEWGNDLEPFLATLPLTPKLEAFIASLDARSRDTNDFLVETNLAVHRAVDYVIRMEPGVQTPEETLTLGRGSCRDSAWLLVQVLRRLGVAARFVSGYLVQLVADQKPVDGPAGPSADFTDLHAWCECFIPGAGWIGLDPTSGLLAAEGHIPLSATPSPASSAPIAGLVEDVDAEFDFDMSVMRVVDRARVTKPYDEREWQRILSLGDSVDERLTTQDVRLSVGGEPTFVSTERPDDDEWNTAALGDHKAEVADRLTRRLMKLWSPGGVIHHGQGKWYPGEQLPRWAYACYSRTDGVPLWRDERLLAESGKDYGHGPEDAGRFLETLAGMLGLEEHGGMEAFEDVWYYLWRERRLPTNVDPFESRLDDEMERARLARVFGQGLDHVVGWVLPLEHAGTWRSGSWFLRSERCYLHPGDSPMGFRLPVDSIPWIAETDRAPGFPLDPFAPREALPGPFDADREVRMQAARGSVELRMQDHFGAPGRGTRGTEGPPSSQRSALDIVRSALCVEPRGGQLKIFLPPLERLEHFVDLIDAIEHTAAKEDLPVQLEGYPAPRDPRLREWKVTPDPGVIEVNVPPTQGWREAVQQSEELYDAARHEKLAAEKFEVDGAHIGSGGGNHVVLGSLEAEDSPFLRRPDLLASMVRCWHNHPSLSYLFSGRFIGPTSQAPRVDEARDDSVHELELALAQIPRPDGGPIPPWLVDRVMRNVLIDVTGNTHRTEFCIDKLYSPDGPTGRLGLLELRAFEMPPHERMSAVQQLLVRSLIARFWDEPNERPLIHWGTGVHDQFMLPHWVEKDFGEVLADLRRSGFEIDDRWFEPHFEFRFPHLGELNLDTMRLELRGALEPWHVLGEEVTASGQARYVDSSVERLQVKVEGFSPERYRVVCNGSVMPMKPTGTNGEYVGGVRYRAWQPPHCLHPRIPVHSPLHFDFYDTWNERSIAGCTYHVVHPGGRASEVRPVNAAAAESRRLARFTQLGHRQGTYRPVDARPHPRFPNTLDLRWTHAETSD